MSDTEPHQHISDSVMNKLSKLKQRQAFRLVITELIQREQTNKKDNSPKLKSEIDDDEDFSIALTIEHRASREHDKTESTKAESQDKYYTSFSLRMID